MIQNSHLKLLFQAQAGGTTWSLLINLTLSLSHASSTGPSQASTLLLYLKQDLNTIRAYMLPPGSDWSHTIKFCLWVWHSVLLPHYFHPCPGPHLDIISVPIWFRTSLHVIPQDPGLTARFIFPSWEPPLHILY